MQEQCLPWTESVISRSCEVRTSFSHREVDVPSSSTPKRETVTSLIFIGVTTGYRRDKSSWDDGSEASIMQPKAGNDGKLSDCTSSRHITHLMAWHLFSCWRWRILGLKEGHRGLFRRDRVDVRWNGKFELPFLLVLRKTAEVNLYLLS